MKDRAAAAVAVVAVVVVVLVGGYSVGVDVFVVGGGLVLMIFE